MRHPRTAITIMEFACCVNEMQRLNTRYLHKLLAAKPDLRKMAVALCGETLLKQPTFAGCAYTVDIAEYQCGVLFM